MAVSDYDTDPANNVTISGINIAEGCPPGNLNNAIRQMMADTKGLQDALPDTSTLMPKAAGTFSGTQPVYDGRGAYLHHNSNSNLSGRVYVLADGTATPTLANGDLVLFYTP